jgi:hypothetical protein
MLDKYDVVEMIKFVQIINCMSYDRFKEMYNAVFGFADDGYVQEKFNIANSRFNSWFCSIDPTTLNKMFKFCLNNN